MKARFVIPLIVCMLLTAASAAAAWNGEFAARAAALFADRPNEALLRVEAASEKLYAAAYSGNRQDAYRHAQRLRQLLNDEKLHVYGTAGGWSAIASDAAAMEKALAAGAPGTAWVEEASRIRLAADAMVRPESALWLQYEKLLAEDVMRLKQDFKRHSGSAAEAAAARLNVLRDHARRVEPAAIAAGSGLRMRELMERISYSGRLLESSVNGQPSGDAVRSIEHSFRALELAIRGIFESRESDGSQSAVAIPSVSHPIRWALFMGAFISAVLSFAGWRKYKNNPYGVKPLA